MEDDKGLRIIIYSVGEQELDPTPEKIILLSWILLPGSGTFKMQIFI